MKHNRNRNELEVALGQNYSATDGQLLHKPFRANVYISFQVGPTTLQPLMLLKLTPLMSLMGIWFLPLISLLPVSHGMDDKSQCWGMSLGC